jgi:hypothetical protein
MMSRNSIKCCRPSWSSARPRDIARSHAYEAPKPLEFGQAGAYWDNIGWRLDVGFTQLGHSIRPADHMTELAPRLPDKYAPWRYASNDERLDGANGLLLTPTRRPPLRPRVHLLRRQRSARRIACCALRLTASHGDRPEIPAERGNVCRRAAPLPRIPPGECSAEVQLPGSRPSLLRLPGRIRRRSRPAEPPRRPLARLPGTSVRSAPSFEPSRR